MCRNGTQVPCKVPSVPNPTTRYGWPQHHGLRPLLFSNSDVGSFTSHKNKSVKVLWDGTYGFSSLSETTRKSNHLQMSLQRQCFLLSYLKTLSVSPPGVWTRDLPLGRPALSQLSQPGGGKGLELCCKGRMINQMKPQGIKSISKPFQQKIF